MVSSLCCSALRSTAAPAAPACRGRRAAALPALQHTAAPALAQPPASCSSSAAAGPCRRARRGVAVRSIPVQGPGQPASEPSSVDPAAGGQVTAQLIESMRAKIGKALATADVKIADAYGDGRHVSIDVVSELFEGQTAVKRQRMVYKAIWLELQDVVHAVDAMSTKTPAEAGK